ncbi:Flp pilus assembly protein TadG [Pseudomonas sp. JUb42]|jgi:Flp pilus assembly protein TadG|uniref:TadE/TadG family type IV pilus assembly protein n=1 Tax=Pseudomonas sp. JUb42 TaxID=2940611 RepID=UPI0021689C03|nr:TadE/TadG family type IV pilus assembly protein [Pseudomonas sp. JUb42]MCS3469851.1 Flp pilus assembly protein TadG [Pseudomonas sp. JUb42]
MQSTPRNFSAHRQKGAAAIEFAAVFIAFFAVFYGLVSYCLPLLMMQSFNAAASEAVRRSVALSPSIPNYQTLIISQARSVLTTQLNWLPTALAFNLTTDADVSYSPAGVLTVKINYPTSRINQVIPFLVLPGIGQVPNLPATLSAQASMQLVP